MRQLRRYRGRRGVRAWPASAACLTLTAAVTLAGCGAAAHHPPASAHATGRPATAPTPAATRTPFGAADWACLDARERREVFVLYGPGHTHLAALSIGTGRVAVILAHQASGSLCQWWPYARSLAARFRVVAFDFDGAGASSFGNGDYPGEVAAAAEWARKHGSRRIVLMGASMGGTAVMVAAARLGSSIAGVIDLSGPASFAGMDALGAARRVHVPALFAYGTRDFGFAEDVRHVRAATAARDKPIIAVRTTNHGVDLVTPEIGYPRVRESVLRFVRRITRR
jgi:pimeloyl-ACP methyl ester carboxylesterase